MVKPKRKFICEVECPQCSEKLEVFQKTETIEPAQKAQKTITYWAQKSTQTQLP